MRNKIICAMILATVGGCAEATTADLPNRRFSAVELTTTEMEMVTLAAQQVCVETDGEYCPDLSGGSATIEVGQIAYVSSSKVVILDQRADFNWDGLLWADAKSAFLQLAR